MSAMTLGILKISYGILFPGAALLLVCSKRSAAAGDENAFLARSPSFKNTASIFPEISFIQYFPLFSCKQYDVITDLICIIENANISKTKKRYFKKKNAILLYFERP